MRHPLFRNLIAYPEPGVEAVQPPAGVLTAVRRNRADALGSAADPPLFLRRAPFGDAMYRDHLHPLRVMKFGGTSVGDASCIRRVAEIILDASRESRLVVVVSAMGGVTDRLIEAGKQSEKGARARVEAILEELWERHEEAARALIRSAAGRRRLSIRMKEIFQEGESLCQRTLLRRELTPEAGDAISSLGERLCAPLVAAALADRQAASESVEATELVVTDAYHGGAEPLMEPTRERCEARLRPLFDRGVVPVVTGFIGATLEGKLTTLGRGGSDYSATILGAALGADEVIIWTDVDGLLTADPRIASEARTIPEISYHEASVLARFGAKVLHPKTLHALTCCGIPVWIRNTFAPEGPGTKVTPEGPAGDGEVKALAAVRDAAMISSRVRDASNVSDVFERILAAADGARANILLAWYSLSRNEIYFAAPSPAARCAVDALQREFNCEVEFITLDPDLAIVTGAGLIPGGASGSVGAVLSALDRAGVSLIAAVEGFEDGSISFVVDGREFEAALITAHREFQLGPAELPSSSPTEPLPELHDVVVEV